MSLATDPLSSTDNRIKGTAALLETIQRDQWVSRRNALWRVPGDSTFDDPPPADRLWIRVTPKVVSTRRLVSIGPGGCWAEVWMELACEIQAPGEGWTEAAAFWEEIEAALGAQETTAEARTALRQRLKSYGVLDWKTARSPDADRADGDRKVMGSIQYRVVVRQ